MKMMKRMRMGRMPFSRRRPANKLIDLTIDCFDLDSSFSTEYDADYEKSTDSWRVDKSTDTWCVKDAQEEGPSIDPFGTSKLPSELPSEHDEEEEETEHSSRWETFVEGSSRSKLGQESPVVVQRKLSVTSSSTMGMRWNDSSTHNDDSPEPTSRRISMNDTVAVSDLPPSFVSRRRSRFSDATIGSVLDENEPVTQEELDKALAISPAAIPKRRISRYSDATIGSILDENEPVTQEELERALASSDLPPSYVSRRISRYSDATLGTILDENEPESPEEPEEQPVMKPFRRTSIGDCPPPMVTRRRDSQNNTVTVSDLPPSFVSRRSSRYSDFTFSSILSTQEEETEREESTQGGVPTMDLTLSEIIALAEACDREQSC